MMRFIQQHISSEQTRSGCYVNFARYVYKSIFQEYVLHISCVCSTTRLNWNSGVLPCLNYSGGTVVISFFSPAVVLIVAMRSIFRPCLHLSYCFFCLSHCNTFFLCAISICMNHVYGSFLPVCVIPYLIRRRVCRIPAQCCINLVCSIWFWSFRQDSFQCVKAALVQDINTFHHG